MFLNRSSFFISAVCFLFLSACSSDAPVKPEKRVDLGGYIGSQPMTEEDQVIQKRALIAKQNEEIDRQAREIQDLKRQQHHNQKMRDYSKRTFKHGSESWTEGETEEWATEEPVQHERRVIDPSDERY